MAVQETDLTLIDGKSMRDRILDAKKAQKAGEPITIGKSFYSRLREEYGSASGLGCSMTILDEGEPDDAALQQAVCSMLKHNRETSFISQWLMTSGRCNQKNFVGLCRAFLLVPGSQPHANALLGLELLQYCHRIRAHEAFASEFFKMRGYFDTRLDKTYLHMKSQRQACSVWWSSVRDFSGQLLPIEDVDKLFACTTKWSDVKVELTRGTGQSAVGAKVFAAALRTLLDEEASTKLDDAVNAWLNLSEITVEVVKESERKLIAGFKTLGLDMHASFARRAVIFMYRGIALQSHVHSLTDEWHLKKEATLRTIGVRSGSLNAL